MSRIRATNTKPELAVRRFLHHRGLRYRLYPSGMPGKPDLVFARLHVCLFVHGCFWHGCKMCVDGTRAVKSNSGYWLPKLAANRERDAQHKMRLEELGWTVLTIWECEVSDQQKLERLFRFLNAPREAIKGLRVGRTRR